MKRLPWMLLTGILLLLVIAAVFIRRGAPGLGFVGADAIDEETGLLAVPPEKYREAWLIDLVPFVSATPESIARRERMERQWREVEFVGAGEDVNALAAAWRESIRDHGKALQPGQAEQLLLALARHANVRAQRNPSGYLRLVNESPNLIWNDFETVMEFSGMPGAIRFAGLDEPNANTPEELLAWLWKGLFDQHDHVFSHVGAGSDGAVILVVRERILESELASLGFTGKYSIDRERWRGEMLSTAIPFQRPIRTAREYLNEHSSVLVAYAHVVVELADGRVGTWITEWYFDEDTGQWVCEDMSHTSHKAMFMIY